MPILRVSCTVLCFYNLHSLTKSVKLNYNYLLCNTFLEWTGCLSKTYHFLVFFIDKKSSILINILLGNTLSKHFVTKPVWQVQDSIAITLIFFFFRNAKTLHAELTIDRWSHSCFGRLKGRWKIEKRVHVIIRGCWFKHSR